MKNCNILDKYKEFFNVVGFLNLQRIELTSKPQLIQFFIDNMLLAIINSHVNMLEIYTQKPSHTQHIYTHIYVHCIYIYIYLYTQYIPHTQHIRIHIHNTHTCVPLPSILIFIFFLSGQVYYSWSQKTDISSSHLSCRYGRPLFSMGLCLLCILLELKEVLSFCFHMPLCFFWTPVSLWTQFSQCYIVIITPYANSLLLVMLISLPGACDFFLYSPCDLTHSKHWSYFLTRKEPFVMQNIN